jgi:hypothetical protein
VHKSISSNYVYFISICALFSNSLFIFSNILFNSTLYSLSTLFKYIFFNSFIPFKYYIFYSFLIHRDHHRESTVNHHKPNTTPSPATTNQQKPTASASTCGLHPWLHEQILKLVSLGKDPIEVDLDANGSGFPRAPANHEAPALLGPSRDRQRKPTTPGRDLRRKPQAETKKPSTTMPGRIFKRGEGKASWRKWENREEKGKKREERERNWAKKKKNFI